MSMNPRETTEKIRIDYQDYIASILGVKDREITELAHQEIKSAGLVKGPYLETTLPFEEGESLKELAESGLISKEFEKMGAAVHYDDWHLRIHQVDALKHIIQKKRNMVVSTGTGSGKTECYLYPVFNALMREKEAGTLDEPGVRALLIFPMNALANDQQKKLRKLLKNYPDITFGRYTGETSHRDKKIKESPEMAEARLHKEYDETHIYDTDEAYKKSIPNEMMCREMMAKKPPHILLTNYAMLEYMLLQPDTAPFFDNESAKHWRFIVIDEAHTYKGANGTEIAYLLRRVKERIRHHMKDDFRCIATSATLGSNDGKEGLALFAEHLFSEPFTAEDIITTKRQERERPSDGRRFSIDEYIALKEDTKDLQEAERGKVLFDALSKDLRLFDLYSALSNKPRRIEEVAEIVFVDLENKDDREKALILLIELSAAAKKSDFESALLPARYHLFIKSLEGMFAQYYPEKKVFLDRKEKVSFNNKNITVFELANCQKCTQEYLVGKMIELDSKKYLIQTSSVGKPDYFFMAQGKENMDLTAMDDDDSDEGSANIDSLDKYTLCLCCGRITPIAETHSFDCCEVNDPGKIVEVYHLKYSGKSNESNCCPCCGATKKGLIKRFLTANQPATFAVAKSLYDAIPPRPINTSGAKLENDPFDDPFEDDLFSDEQEETKVSSDVIDESGRKLLIFSDNRQEAAFFAGFFEKRYNQIMWRKLIIKCLKEADNHKLCIDDLITQVRIKADKEGLYTLNLKDRKNLTDLQKLEVAKLYVMNEFINPDVDTALEGLGYVQIYPQELTMKRDEEIVGLHGQEVWSLIRFTMDTLRQKVAVTLPEGIWASDGFFKPKNHEGFFKQSGHEANQHIVAFLPESSRQNKRSAFLSKLLKIAKPDSEVEEAMVNKELSRVYNYLLAMKQKGFISEVNNSTTGTLYKLNYAKWYFQYMDDDDTLYRCNKCNKIFGYSIKDICPEMKCDGRLIPITSASLKKEPYYNGLFEDDKFIPMVAREHTAQLSAKTAGSYQKDFEEGNINVLSCSTTFEMGVDVGELEATFQRNVPPETANYIQRAGRAGRRTSSAAFSVTFARRNSHDITFFQNPVQIIAGKISPPVLEISNEKIAERHLNSLIISWFFKKHPEYFEDKTKKIISFGSEENMAVILKGELDKKPEELLESIHASLPMDVCNELKVDEWGFIDSIVGEDGSLTKAIEERAVDISGLRKFSEHARESAPEGVNFSKELKKAASAEDLIQTLDQQPSIAFLSSKGVIPKYGFPIDSVSLDIISGSQEDAGKIDLSRDLKMAISEFAPPAKIVANGKIWESYAINTVPDKSWPAYVYHLCPQCKKIYHPENTMVDIYYNLESAPSKVCTTCGTLTNPKLFIIPWFGFSTYRDYQPETVGDSKPSSYYSTRTQFWGIEERTERQKTEAMEGPTQIAGKTIDRVYSPGGKLFVLNQGLNERGLHICPECGYTKDPAVMLKRNEHRNKYKAKCSCRQFRNASLGHVFSTDILKISLPNHIVGLKEINVDEQKNQYYSVLYAILEGACKALEISREDISGCVTENMEFVLFDDTAGGSGFVKQIYNNLEKVLREALNKVDGQCGCTAETSCYGCLRNYSNQFFHDQLSRGLAKNYLNWLLDSTVIVTPEEGIPENVENNNRVKKSRETETIGSLTLDFAVPDASTYPSIVTQLEDLMEIANDDTVKKGYSKLIEQAQQGNYEKPISECSLPAPERDLWPDLFWPESRVALFSPDIEDQYEILRHYNWYCYIVDEEIDTELVFSHIKKGE